MNDVVDESASKKVKRRREIVKSATAFRTISEVANVLEIPQHVLRFWETKFNQVKPLKRGGGRRYYRPSDIDLLRAIRDLLYHDGYTIRGVQRLLRENGVKALLQSVASDQPASGVAEPSGGIVEPSRVEPSGPMSSEPDIVSSGVTPTDDAGGQKASAAGPDQQALRDILEDLIEMRSVLSAASGR